MNSKNRALVVLTSFFGAVIGRQANAAVSEITWLEPNDQQTEDLTDLLIREKIFSLSKSDQAIKIDETKLLQKIKSELAKKLSDNKINYEDKEYYKTLLKRLNPGSFGRKNNEDDELQTMDFQKPN